MEEGRDVVRPLEKVCRDTDLRWSDMDCVDLVWIVSVYMADVSCVGGVVKWFGPAVGSTWEGILGLVFSLL